MTDDCAWVHDVCSGEGGRCAIYGTAPASMFDDNDLLVAFEVIRELRAEIAELKAALVEMAVLP